MHGIGWDWFLVTSWPAAVQCLVENIPSQHALYLSCVTRGLRLATAHFLLWTTLRLSEVSACCSPSCDMIEPAFKYGAVNSAKRPQSCKALLKATKRPPMHSLRDTGERQRGRWHRTHVHPARLRHVCLILVSDVVDIIPSFMTGLPRLLARWPDPDSRAIHTGSLEYIV